MAREPNYALALPSGAGWRAAYGSTTSSGRIAGNANVVGAAGAAVADPALTGKVYTEIYVRAFASGAADKCVVGLSGTTILSDFGVANGLGAWGATFGVRADGQIQLNGSNVGTLGVALTADDRVCFAIDWPARKVWVRRNAEAWVGGDPVAGVGGYDLTSLQSPSYLAFSGGQAAQVALCYDALMFSIPAGFSAQVTQTPNPTPKYVSGVVRLNGDVQAGLIVRAYDASNGQLLGSTTTDANGAYSIDALGRSTVFVTAHDLTTFDALIHDGVTTVGTGAAALPSGQLFVFNFVTGKWVITDGYGVPAGGAAGQVLTKNSSTDGDVIWGAGGGGGLPAGGAAGQVLTKNSSTDGDAGWATPASGGGGSTTIGAHRYWGLFDVMGDNAVSIAEITIRATVGGADIVPTTVTAKNSYGPDTTPDKAIDGVASTFWASSLQPNWFVLDFGATPRTMAELRITARNDGWHQQRPNQFEICYSDDGVVWRRVARYAYPLATVSGETLIVPVPLTQ